MNHTICDTSTFMLDGNNRDWTIHRTFMQLALTSVFVYCPAWAPPPTAPQLQRLPNGYSLISALWSSTAPLGRGLVCLQEGACMSVFILHCFSICTVTGEHPLSFSLQIVKYYQATRLLQLIFDTSQWSVGSATSCTEHFCWGCLRHLSCLWTIKLAFTQKYCSSFEYYSMLYHTLLNYYNQVHLFWWCCSFWVLSVVKVRMGYGFLWKENRIIYF